MSAPVAVYVHTPFCPSKCGYCDFNSYAMTGEIVERTVQAIRSEIVRSPWRGRPAKTIFFGGGTPTFLSEAQITGLLQVVLEVHPPIEGCEITSEGNPGTVDIPKFEAMRAAGFNRISLGAQSFQQEDLIRLGRVHEASHVGRAVAAARRAGFTNLNLDLMFALPGQSLGSWRRNIETALALEPEHLSLYCLTIEPNTRYYKLQVRGMLDLPSDEVQVAMYDAAVTLAAERGYAQYEISNFAEPGTECAHNLCYWRGEEYAGYGPGAVGCMSDGDARVRYTVLKQPERYCEAVEGGHPTAFEHERLTPEMERFERIMLGLRLNEGMDLRTVEIAPSALRKLSERGWVAISDTRAVLTPEGRHFCSAACAELA
ncbi:MAG: radical SAM family heme chaperone HemW [Chthonomonas sp.]|nr:radical SAM family heme chaperone HemW [Chthonomonas sp.]